MGSLREIRKRIRSVQSSKKITNAMKLVAASKLRGALEAVVGARPYAHELRGMVEGAASELLSDPRLPCPGLLAPRKTRKKALLLAITADRGLCGSFNASILRRARAFLEEGDFAEVDVVTVGKKGHEFFERNAFGAHVEHREDVWQDLDFAQAQALADKAVPRFEEGELCAVFVLFARFHSAISQEPVLKQVLPVQRDATDSEGDKAPTDQETIFEPSSEVVLEQLAASYVASEIWHGLLESYASEQGARMAAMDSASKNAGELIDSLSLQYNRARQAAITGELMDIVGGANAVAS